MIGRRGRHVRTRSAAALPPGAGAIGPAGRRPSASPETSLSPDHAVPDDTWDKYHQERIRLLDTLEPGEMFDVLVFVSGSAPEAVYEALTLVKPQLIDQGMMP